MPSEVDLDTSQIKEWRSIVTLIVFIGTNILVLFPFHVPVRIPSKLWVPIWKALSRLRIISPIPSMVGGERRKAMRLKFPIDFVTAPLIADLFLLAILAIGREEVHDGTIGADHIFPIDIMAFFITLAYIAISIDASGLIRWLAFKVLQKGGKNGRLLFGYLYAFFFVLAGVVGNDPVILSGTAFLAYMTRVSSNIVRPRAWIFTQFAMANIGSAILVSSNPTNLVLAGAFNIKFISYTANMIVPVVVTAIVLFPFLLYIVFFDEDLVPRTITMHELPEEYRRRKAVNPNIPQARSDGSADQDQEAAAEHEKLLSLEEIMNPFLDKKGAGAGAVIMVAALVSILVLNAVTDSSKPHPVYWVTAPAAFIMFCWDIWFGWHHRQETRDIAKNGRKRPTVQATTSEQDGTDPLQAADQGIELQQKSVTTKDGEVAASSQPIKRDTSSTESSSRTLDEERGENLPASAHRRPTLVSVTKEVYLWCQATFPTATAVINHLPFALIPFAFAMFVLVQALATKGWISVFAHGWDHWVDRTGTIGAIGGMAFLSVIMCNFAGTNIGTTILLCRVIQDWVALHERSGVPITQRTFWATVYSMAVGVNYGAFSAAFSAALAGLLWRDILEKKKIYVGQAEFARYNLPIIAVAMAVGCAVLIGEVYIVRGEEPYRG